MNNIYLDKTALKNEGIEKSILLKDNIFILRHQKNETIVGVVILLDGIPVPDILEADTNYTSEFSICLNDNVIIDGTGVIEVKPKTLHISGRQMGYLIQGDFDIKKLVNSKLSIKSIGPQLEKTAYPNISSLINK